VLIRTDNVQHQQEIGSKEFILHSEEDLKIIKKKFFNIKSSMYSGNNKCNDGQTKSIGNERRLSSKQKNISMNSKVHRKRTD
jgi:hypothetical protein